MKVIKLNNVNIFGTSIDKAPVLIDDNGVIVFLPVMYMLQLRINSSTQRIVETVDSRTGEINKQIKTKSVSDQTVESYSSELVMFMSYLNKLHKEKSTPPMHFSEAVSEEVINHYINKVVAQRKVSILTVEHHVASLSAYYNYLLSAGITKYRYIRIFKNTRKTLSAKTGATGKINYVTVQGRNELLRACSSQRDKLILKMGFEVGLRSKENQGLLLNDFVYNNKTQKGLLSLFTEMNADTGKQTFTYFLDGHYTKAGKSRLIYFSRELLELIRRYYHSERMVVINAAINNAKIQGKEFVEHNHLFINNDQEYKGYPISKGRASTVFSRVLNKVEWLNQHLVYHDLRHSFATELYHYLLDSNSGRETRSESAALLEVAERLGHELSKDGKPTTSTTRYIRLRELMITLEEKAVA